MHSKWWKRPHPNRTGLLTEHPVLSLQMVVREDWADPSNKSACCIHLRDFVWAQIYISLQIFVLKWKTLQHSLQPATGASFIQNPWKAILYATGRICNTDEVEQWLMNVTFPTSWHVRQPDPYGSLLISASPHAPVAAPGHAPHWPTA